MQMAFLHRLGLLARGWLSRMQVLLPAQPGDAKKHSNAWEQGLWAAKVGATTVGIWRPVCSHRWGHAEQALQLHPYSGHLLRPTHAALLHPARLLRSSHLGKRA